MRLLNVLLLFLTGEICLAKRQKRGRLKGGTKVNSATKYPSYVAFVKSSGFPFCGGTILDEYTVLTASHCEPTTSETILYGTNKRAGKDSGQGVKVGIKSVELLGKETGSGGSWENDVAIIKLQEPIKLGATAKKVELGTYNEFIKHVLLAKKKCTVIGNGRTDITGQYSDTLKEGKVQLSVHAGGFDCAALGVNKNCIVWANSDKVLVGNGDSGGPLYCDVNGRMKQFGIASWGTNGKSTDKGGFMGYATTFSPDNQRKLQKWNPNNRVPADFRGTNDLIRRYKKNPGSIKEAPGGSGSSRQSGSSQSSGSSQQSHSPSRYGSSQQYGSSRQTRRYQQPAQQSRQHQAHQSRAQKPQNPQFKKTANSCVELKYCNGNGKCGHFKTGGVKCFCNSGYTGRDCTEKVGGNSGEQPQRRSQQHHGHQSRSRHNQAPQNRGHQSEDCSCD